jgi:Rad3-related DNA helicase
MKDEEPGERLNAAMADALRRLAEVKARAEAIARCADRMHDRIALRLQQLRSRIETETSDVERLALEGDYLTLLTVRARAAQVKALAMRDADRLKKVI